VRGKNALINYNLLFDIDTKSQYKIPPWHAINFKLDLSLTKYHKENTSSIIYKKLFNENI
jgi:hypothetical protein